MAEDEFFRQQEAEITEHYVYSSLAKKASGEEKKILERIAIDELKHYNILKKITKREAKPNWLNVYAYSILASIFGLTFTLKLMEGKESTAQETYNALMKKAPEIAEIFRDEEKHEKAIIDMIPEERLEYISSIVLGLNDALVELSGSLVGFTLAFRNGKIIAMAGLILGIAAALSMAASSYLAASEDNKKKPIKSAAYTGAAYITTVLALVLPYFVFEDVFVALALTIFTMVIIIALYTFYATTVKGERFLPRFVKMLAISLTVALISLILGQVINELSGSSVQ